MGCTQSTTKTSVIEDSVRKGDNIKPEEPTQTGTNSSDEMKVNTSKPREEVIYEDSTTNSPKMEVVLSPSSPSEAKEEKDKAIKDSPIRKNNTSEATTTANEEPDTPRTDTPRRRRKRSVSSGVDVMRDEIVEADIAGAPALPALQPVAAKKDLAPVDTAPEKKEVEKAVADVEEKTAPEESSKTKEQPAPPPATTEKPEEPKIEEKAAPKEVEGATEEPKTEVVDETKKCAGCDAVESSDGTFKLCAKCKDVKYCSRDCQKAHWKAHKQTCCKDNMDASSSHLNGSLNDVTEENGGSKQSKEDAAKELEQHLDNIRKDSPSAEDDKKEADSKKTTLGEKEEEDPVDIARKESDKENAENVAPTSKEDDSSTAKPEVRTCEGCGAVEESKGDFKYCAKCNVSVYCSRACQKKHWKEHKKSCCKKDPSKKDVTAEANNTATVQAAS